MTEISSTRIDSTMFYIIDKDEVKRYSKMERSEIDIPLEILEKSISVMRALGHDKIKLIAYHCLAEKGFLLSATDKSCGIKISD